MKRGTAAGSVLAILAFLLMRGIPTMGPGSAAEIPAQALHVASAQQAEQDHQALSREWPEGPWEASRRHFAGKRVEGECPLFIVTGDSDREKKWCIPPQEHAAAMVAIVPDPVHSHMSLVFDRSVEALQLAAQSMNYVMDDYWLPWKPAGSDGSQPSTKDQNEREAQPGLVMFRWNGKASPEAASILYVFLVADTSTAGINGSQFNHAVDYVQKICAEQESGCGKRDRISIMGPTFSGSLESLRKLTGAKNQINFTAYSGTVSSLCAIYNQGLLREDLLPEVKLANCTPSDQSQADKKVKPVPQENKPSNLEFLSMVNDTETAVRMFVDFLQKNNNIDCDGYPQVAVFSEAATTYGSAAGNVVGRNVRRDPDDHACELDSFSYPREISSLRNAYQKGIGLSAASGNNTGAAQNSLPFDLTDRQPNKSDEPPDFSMQQGPLSKEAVLMQFGLQAQRRHYRYIGVIGSNVLDVLFLTNYLRSAYPDARLFVLNADLMFERQLDNTPYIGMLTITTYPLLGRNLYWIRGQPLSPCNPNQAEPGSSRKYLPFADQYEEGQYNAALLAIQQVVPADCSKTRPDLAESCGPFVKPQAGFDPKSARLPLWLTAVGTGGYWPIQVLSVGQSGVQQPEAPSPQLEDSDFSAGWRVITVLLCALAFLHIFVLSTAPNAKSRFRDFALGCADPGQRLFFINVASACLAAALGMLAAPAWHLSASEGVSVLVIVWAAVPLAILGLFLACVWLNYVFHGMWHKAKEEKDAGPAFWKRNSLYAAVWFLAVIGEGVWLWLLRDGPTHYGFFFAYRAVNLATGVSPFTPILPLFAALYCWCIFEIWRLRFHDHVRPRLNVTNGMAGARSEKCIADSVYKYFLERNYQTVFLLIFGLWLCFCNPFQPFWLFERAAFGGLYGVLLGILVLLTLSGGLRLLQIWSRLRRLLHELEWSPIRLAFSRLAVGSWSPIWQSGGQEAEWTNMARSFEVMQQISSCCSQPEAKKTPEAAPILDPTLNSTLKGAIKAALEKRDELRRQLPDTAVSSKAGEQTADAVPKPHSNSSREIFQAVEKHFGDLQERLATVLNACLNILEGYWQVHCSEEKDELEKGEKQVIVYCQPEKTDQRTQLMQRLEEYVALRYVAFIRGVLGHIRRLLILLALLFSLALISLNVYSFEPHQSLVWSFTAIFAVLGLTILVILAQVHKDPILSRITGTKPNELGLDFYYRLASLGAVPLFTLLATHFPVIGRYLSSFFQPGLDVLK